MCISLLPRQNFHITNPTPSKNFRPIKNVKPFSERLKNLFEFLIIFFETFSKSIALSGYQCIIINRFVQNSESDYGIVELSCDELNCVPFVFG